MTFFKQYTNLIGYIMIISFGLLASFFIHIKKIDNLKNAQNNYIIESQKEFELTAKDINNSFQEIYSNLRTISLLPSVKNVDREGNSLNDDAKFSIQQIYNNLKGSVNVSEVYIVPVSIKADKIDSFTKHPEAPIIMYDNLIINAENSTTDSSKSPIEQLELYEYRLFEKQMKWFTENYGDISSIKGFDIPMISGSEVITCDNSTYEKTKNDQDRTGIILSVPFYGPDKKLKGTVSAVILNSAIRSYLPNQNFALIALHNNYITTSPDMNDLTSSQNYYLQGLPDSNLIYSQRSELKIADPQGKWILWSARPDIEYLTSNEVKSINNFINISHGVIFIITLAAIFMWHAIIDHKNQLSDNHALMENIKERTREIEKLAEEKEWQEMEAKKEQKSIFSDIATNFDKSVKSSLVHVSDESSEVETNSKNLIQISTRNSELAKKALETSIQTSEISSQIAAAAEQLSSSIQHINEQTQRSNQVVGEAANKATSAKESIDELSIKSAKVNEIIEVITNIAEQINLLALNATIESARAGEAGRGFAVVAGEVKNLANQVAGAAEDITDHINEMIDATTISVQTVNGILSIISEVSNYSKSISLAIKEQHAAASEITHNIAETVKGVKTISDDIEIVEKGSRDTCDAGNNVLKSAEKLSNQSIALKNDVDHFLESLVK